MTPEKLNVSKTTDGQPPRPGFENAGAPAPINPATGQHQAYWVLSPEERAKGFVRPVRLSYKHVGRRPKYPIRDLTKEEKIRYAGYSYVKVEVYPDSESPVTGRFWTDKDLKSGCGTITTMSRDIAETYARQPDYYGATMCVHCRAHFPVGKDGEFVWMDGDRETAEKLGT